MDLPFLPDWVSPPGDSIKDILEHKRMSKTNFAKKIERSSKFVDRLLIGEEIIDENLAQKLAAILGASTGFWMRRDSHYRSEKIRLGL